MCLPEVYSEPCQTSKIQSRWCCVPPDFVVEINNFFNLVLFSAVIHERRGKKLISETIKHQVEDVICLFIS